MKFPEADHDKIAPVGTIAEYIRLFVMTGWQNMTDRLTRLFAALRFEGYHPIGGDLGDVFGDEERFGPDLSENEV